MANHMPYEVEQKFRVDDRLALVARLAACGIACDDVEEQTDVYLAHPSRDFSKTDEALRIRIAGAECVVTYKGPKLDAVTKTRQELELPIAGGPAAVEDWTKLFEAIGFRPVASVCKRRCRGAVMWAGREFEVCLDDVADVGSFVELETIAEPSDLDAARVALAELAARLELTGNERRSYLEMLLENRARGEAAPEGGPL